MSPVVARLRASYPAAHLTLLVGARAQAPFDRDPRVQRVINIEEFAGWWGALRLVRCV